MEHGPSGSRNFLGFLKRKKEKGRRKRNEINVRSKPKIKRSERKKKDLRTCFLIDMGT